MKWAISKRYTQDVDLIKDDITILILYFIPLPLFIVNYDSDSWIFLNEET